MYERNLNKRKVEKKMIRWEERKKARKEVVYQ